MDNSLIIFSIPLLIGYFLDLLLGDPTKAKTKLGWKPKYDLAGLVEEMVASDLAIFKKDIHLLN